jgi:hypothetical protein
MSTHNLTAITEVIHIKGLDEVNDPPCVNYQDPVYKNKPFEQGALFLLAEIRGLLKKIDES